MSPVKRVKGSKSRTGCQTCKLRHLKCDEQKPVCARCTVSNWICEGYGYQTNAQAFHIVSFSSPPGLRSSLDVDDNRSYAYFKDSAALALMRFDGDGQFWFRTVLQFCDHSPAVLHATLALSTLHESYHNVFDGTTATRSNLSFLRQYNKSISHLRESVQPPQYVLTCCILFVCLENLAGNHATALQHLENGLKILQTWRMEANRPAEDESLETLTRIFRRLDFQATGTLNCRAPEFISTSVADDEEERICCPVSFLSLSDAQLALELIIMRSLYALTVKSTQQHITCSEEACCEFDGYLIPRKPVLYILSDRLQQWKEKFDAFSARESKRMQSVELQLGVLLALHHHVTSIMVESKSNPDEKVDPSKFTKLNELANSLINAHSSLTPKFSAYMGVIGPLYFSAMTGTNSHVRRQSIELLHRVKGIEGFWGSKIAAAIADRAWDSKNDDYIELGAISGNQHYDIIPYPSPEFEDQLRNLS